MISIFNGRSRGLGAPSSKNVHMQVEVAFRRFLHHFKGAQLGVFMAISLHADQLGWAWPRVSTICKETGYDTTTVHKALNRLCLTVIKGHRVLLRAKEPPSHYTPDMRDKNYTRNFYLIFPSTEEFERFEAEDGQGPVDENRMVKTVSQKSHSVFSDMENPTRIIGGRSLITKEEPSLKEEPIRDQEETHTHEREPAPSLFEPPAEGVVCVSDDLRFEDYLAYARSQSSFHAPDAWARTHWPARDSADDFLVREWLESQTPEAISEARAAPVTENLFFDEAAHRVRTLMGYGQEPSAIIATMPLDDDVRARLIAKFANVEVSHAESSS